MAINLNNSIPAAPSGAQNVIWQEDSSGDVSAYVGLATTKTTVSPVGGALTINAGLGNSFLVNVNAAITSMAITNPTDGQTISILWQQDSTGHSVVIAPNIVGAPPVDTAPNSSTSYILTYNAADATWYAPTESGAPGVVTSVGLALPSIFTVAGSPVTSAGTLTATLATEPANDVFAGPTSGSAAAPTFRALVAADLPLATSSSFGAVEPDNSTITITAGVISAVHSGTVSSVGLSLPSQFTVSGSPVTSSGVLTAVMANESANSVWSGPTSGSPAAPTFRALVAADLPLATSSSFGAVEPDNSTITIAAGVISAVHSGTVTSVGLSMPSVFSVASSPVTGSGTLAVTLATEVANSVWAGPTSGSAAAPTFRALVAADLPAGTGTVTSVGLTSPGVLYTVSGSPVTTSGTLALSLISQTANTVLAAPNGSSGNPSFRALVAADLPAGTGTVTSVGLTMPSIFTVAGSPITSAGTLGVTLATEAANSVWAGPATGSAAAPTFRALVAADIPSLSYLPLTGGTLTGTLTVDTSSGLGLVVQATTTNATINMLQATSSANTNFQFYANGHYFGVYDITDGATPFAILQNTSMTVAGSMVIGWANSYTVAAAPIDTGFSRISPGVVGLGNGTAGDITGTLELGKIVLSGATPTVSAGQVGLGTTTATTATSGAQTLPGNPSGFLVINIGGTAYKLPYYAS